MSRMDLEKIMTKTNITIIDVREPLEVFFGKKAKGAINIPLRKIPDHIDKFREMDTPIILYCKTGNRSGQALRFLKSQGIRKVYNGGSVLDVNEFISGKLKK